MENDKDNKYIRDIILLALWAVVLFGINIWGYDLWSPDEPRYAEVAREMQVLNNHLVPHINGRPYLEKPPLLMWLMLIYSYPFGDVSEVSARLPSVLSGVAAVLLTYLLARKIAGRGMAWLSALIFMTMQRVWWQARFGQIDMLLTALLLGAVYCFHKWYYSEKKSTNLLILMYLCLLGALFAKGPGTLVFPVLFLISFYWKEKKKIFKIHPLEGFAAVIIIYAVWYAYARWASAEQLEREASHIIGSDLFKQTLGRFIYGVAHPQPPWYYLISVPVDMFPWSLFLLWIIPWVWKNRSESEGIRFLLFWIIPAFIFFSIAVGKRAIYLLPIFPAIAILTALSLKSFEEASTLRWKRGIRILWLVVLLILAIVPFAVLCTEFARIWSPYWVIISVVALVAIVDTLFDFFKHSQVRSILKQIPQHVSLYLFFTALIVFPSVNTIKSVRNFCEPMRLLSKQKVEYEAYSFGFEEEEYTFYAKHFINPFFDEKDLRKISLPESEPYEYLKVISEIHKAYTRKAVEIKFKDTFSPTPEEIEQINSALQKIREEAEKVGKVQMLDQIEQLINREINDFYTLVNKEALVFVLIREEDWKWVVARKPELGKVVKLICTRGEFNRPVFLLSNKSI
ncbi:MAG TPA: glycosyltransferase family 39 protein [Candidatus Hydrogenedens sp.]|nr:glycosyltransferase family 39 protein [Candidatus Hydrogenedens sp.]